MNSWLEVARLLAIEEMKLERGLHLLNGPAGQARALSDAHLATCERLDWAVRKFATTGQWPRLQPLEKTLLKERLLSAAALVHVLSLPVLRCSVPQLSPPELVQWLLIDCWECHGFAAMHDMAEALQPEPPGDNPPPVSLN